jgi:hypothetical protein
MCGGGKALSAGVAQPVPTTSSLPTVKDAPQAMRSSLPSAASPLRVPSGRVTSSESTAGQGRAGG